MSHGTCGARRGEDTRLAEILPPAFALKFSRLSPFAIFGGVVAAGYALGFLCVTLTSRDREGVTRDVITFGFIFFLLLVVILVVTIPFIVHEFLRVEAVIPLDASPRARHISSVNSVPPEPPRIRARRKLHWWMFWLVFLSTPAAVISVPIFLKHFPRLDLLNDGGLVEAVSSWISGSYAAALILAKLHSTTKAQLIVRTLAFGVVFMILLGAISLMGCMAGYRS